MHEVVNHLLRRVVAIVAACVVVQYLLLVYVYPAIAPPSDKEGVFATIGKIAVFGVETTAVYLWMIRRYIDDYKASGWKRRFPHLDLSGTWRTRYQSNKAKHEEGDIGIAVITQDWLGNVSARGSYESRDDDGITDANWETTSFNVIVDSTESVRAIMSYHSRRSPRTGENILAKDGTSARGVEELNVYSSKGQPPHRMEGMFYVYSQKAARSTSGKASWERYATDAPDAPPDVFLNSIEVFASPELEAPGQPVGTEQVGADQPATAPKSKPVGGEEPKPESEGRPQ